MAGQSGARNDIKAARMRHAPVDDRDVVLVEVQLLDGIVTGFDGIDEVAGLLESLDQHLPQTRVVFSHEHSHLISSSHDAASGPASAAAAEATGDAAGEAPVGPGRHD